MPSKNPEIVRRNTVAWRAKNPERARELNRLSYHRNGDKRRATARRKYQSDPKTAILRPYKITKDEYLFQLRAQGGCCAICSRPLKRPHVDHCHFCGNFRTILCPRCNLMVGYLEKFERDPQVVLSYISEHRRCR